MNGKVSMVTGANAGIGKQTALELARRGATVVMVCRSHERGAAAQAEIVAATGNEHVDLLLADLSAQASIRDLAKAFKSRYDRLDVLVNNAGVYLTQRQESVDGLEMTFALNHLGYFLTTLLLWDILGRTAEARVINLASDAHRRAKINFDDLQSSRNYQGFRAYGQSKLANVLFTHELDRRRGDADVTVNAVHPGFVASNFGRNNGGVVGQFMRSVVPLIARSVEKGAETVVYLATSPEVEDVSGKYFTDLKAVRSSSESYDRQAALRLWEVSETLTTTREATLANPS